MKREKVYCKVLEADVYKDTKGCLDYTCLTCPDLIKESTPKQISKKVSITKKVKTQKNTGVEKKKRDKKIILTFDRNKARKRLQLAPLGWNDAPEEIELTLYRTEFLFKNDLFVNEYLKLMEYKKRVGDSSKKYKKRQLAFAERWEFNFDYGLSFWRRSIAYGYGIDGDKGSAVFRVDLRYPKTKILKEFEKVLNEYHSDYNNRIEEIETAEVGNYINPGYKDDWLTWLKASYTNELKGNVPSDIQEYERYLQIWLMRTKGLSWNETIRQWNDSNDYKINIQTARNWYKIAIKLISEGIPGFSPFPKTTHC